MSITVTPKAANQIRKALAKRGGGVGLRYIHARLRERYGADYRVTSGAVDVDGAARWRTVIELPAQPRSP